MNAFNEILGQLIESVPSETWHAQTFFPFRDLGEPKARLFDTCFFRQSASGALGLMWIQFEGRSEVILLPFRLTRYSLEGEFISLPPWSLREATNDGELYEAWRVSLHSKNPLLTSAHGLLHRKYSRGEPSLLALGISSDVRNTCVRIDSQEALKFFHILTSEQPGSLEVEILQYLSEQDGFTNFPKLIAVHDYTSGDLKNIPIAVSMTYIQNSGTLWHNMTRLVQQARFPEKGKEKQSRDTWYEILETAENLGRIVGEFHKVMSNAKHNPHLVPEASTSELRSSWITSLTTRIQLLADEVISYRSQFEDFAETFSDLPRHVETLTEAISGIENPGLRIRAHGHLHLGQILVGNETLYLLDFESDHLDEAQFRNVKHSPVKDIATLAMSLKLAWQTVEKSSSSPLIEAYVDKESGFARHVAKASHHFVEPKTYTPTLDEIENTMIRSYIHILSEDANSRELLPENTMDFRTLFNFYLLTRAMKEIVRDCRAGNPRCRLSLKILQQFLAARPK